jgi:hypothetical protein
MQAGRPRWLRPATFWIPTWRAWLVLVLPGAVLVFGGLRSTHGFLSVQRPVDANVLIVEGWLSDDALAVGLREFHRGAYDVIAASGGPLPKGYLVTGYATYAELAGATLKLQGLPADKLLVASTEKTYRNRTYVSARGVRDALRQRPLEIRGVNVISEGPHARRTWLAYRKVFGKGTPVGIINVPPQDYDPDRWWASSAGLKVTFSEALAWLYESAWDSGR